ncbi:MAG: anaerobic ribonucleoside-triphosphate reductase activating protein [Bacteroidales bacterium]
MVSGEISLLRVVKDTVVDGPGVRISLYGAGCGHRCSGCHNSSSWSIAQGEVFALRELAEELLADTHSNITFTGGDPLFQVESFAELARVIKANSQKSIWCYTGYRIEEVLSSSTLSMILPYIDVLVDGRFEQDLLSPSLPFRGSSNQRLIDVKATLRDGEIRIFEYNPFPDFGLL